jgi:hypothetical protein
MCLVLCGGDRKPGRARRALASARSARPYNTRRNLPPYPPSDERSETPRILDRPAGGRPPIARSTSRNVARISLNILAGLPCPRRWHQPRRRPGQPDATIKATSRIRQLLFHLYSAGFPRSPELAHCHRFTSSPPSPWRRRVVFAIGAWLRPASDDRLVDPVAHPAPACALPSATALQRARANVPPCRSQVNLRRALGPNRQHAPDVGRDSA